MFCLLTSFPLVNYSSLNVLYRLNIHFRCFSRIFIFPFWNILIKPVMVSGPWEVSVSFIRNDTGRSKYTTHRRRRHSMRLYKAMCTYLRIMSFSCIKVSRRGLHRGTIRAFVSQRVLLPLMSRYLWRVFYISTPQKNRTARWIYSLNF